MAAAIISAAKPAIINIVVTGAVAGEHAVPVQWDAKADDGKGRFLMNNILARGETRSFTREQFASGKMTVITAPKTGGLAQTNHFNIAVDCRWPVIFCEKP